MVYFLQPAVIYSLQSSICFPLKLFSILITMYMSCWYTKRSRCAFLANFAFSQRLLIYFFGIFTQILPARLKALTFKWSNCPNGICPLSRISCSSKRSKCRGQLDIPPPVCSPVFHFFSPRISHRGPGTTRQRYYLLLVKQPSYWRSVYLFRCCSSSSTFASHLTPWRLAISLRESRHTLNSI